MKIIRLQHKFTTPPFIALLDYAENNLESIDRKKNMKPIEVARAEGRLFHIITNVTRHSKRLVHQLTNSLIDSEKRKDSVYSLAIVLGEGRERRTLTLELSPLLTIDADDSDANFIDSPPSIVLYRNSLFMADPRPYTNEEAETFLLEVKKTVLQKEVGIKRLKMEIAALEAMDFNRRPSSRPPIPADVKNLIWIRDGGKCVLCGRRENLQFDHIIPFSKGGGDQPGNLQILCASCNSAKSDQI